MLPTIHQRTQVDVRYKCPAAGVARDSYTIRHTSAMALFIGFLPGQVLGGILLYY